MNNACRLFELVWPFIKGLKIGSPFKNINFIFSNRVKGKQCDNIPLHKIGLEL
jgi:hypothetical protein